MPRVLIMLLGLALIVLAGQMPQFAEIFVIAGVVLLIVPLVKLVGVMGAGLIAGLIVILMIVAPIPELYGIWSPIHVEPEYWNDHGTGQRPFLLAILLMLIPMAIILYAKRFVFAKKESKKH